MPVVIIHFVAKLCEVLKHRMGVIYRQELAEHVAKYQDLISDWLPISDDETLENLEARFDDVTTRYLKQEGLDCELVQSQVELIDDLSNIYSTSQNLVSEIPEKTKDFSNPVHLSKSDDLKNFLRD